MGAPQDQVMRQAPLYTLKRSPRRKPSRVSPASRAAEEEQVVPQGQEAVQQGPAEDLVQRVVASHILPQQHQIPGGIEQGRGVQAPRGLKDLLGRPQALRQAMEQARGHEGRTAFGEGREGTLDPKRLDGGLAADAATRGGVEIPLQAPEVHGHLLLQGHAHHVGAAGTGRAGAVGTHLAQVLLAPDDPLRQQEPHGQFSVLARGAHGDGQALMLGPLRAGKIQTDLQGFFDGQVIHGLEGLEATRPADALDGDLGDGCVHGRPSFMHHL
jgi:hypothetical protein